MSAVYMIGTIPLLNIILSVQQAHSTEFNKLRRHTIKNGKHSKNMPQIVNRTEFTEMCKSPSSTFFTFIFILKID